MLNRVIGHPYACSVQQQHRQPIEYDTLAEHISCGAGDLRHDGGVMAGQRIEQAGFSNIGRADDRHAQPFRQHPAAVRLAPKLLQVLQQNRETTRHLAIGQKIDVLVGKIDRGLDPGPQR